MGRGTNLHHSRRQMGMEVKPFMEQLIKFSEEEVPKEWMRREIEVIIFLFERIRYWTPVAEDDSEWPGFKGGHARANWRVTINTIPDNIVGKRGTPAKLLSESTIRQNLSRIGQGTASKQGRADTIWIFNNVHYVQYLENGHSKQAPAGRMVAMSVEETRNFIRQKGW